MSGGGGGDKTWRRVSRPVGHDPAGVGPDPCDIREVTAINSPNRAVIGALRVGDRLHVELIPGPPRRLVLVTDDGQVAGSITSPSLPQLVACIGSGTTYQAEVLSVRGAICQVRVQRQ
jgi:hypothetical protein